MSQLGKSASLPATLQSSPGGPSAPVAVLLAAGAGRRMGGVPKSLLLRDGQTLLARQVQLLAQAGAQRIAVVLGHHAGRLLPVLQDLRAELEGRSAGAVQLSWAINPAPDDGPGSSLRCGLALLPETVPTILVSLADQPLLELDDMQDVLQAWQQRDPGIELLVPVHAGQPGHPIAFGPALRAAVMQMPGGQGVREWRRAHAQQVRSLTVQHARYCTDVDTPQDLQRLQRGWGVALELPAALAETTPCIAARKAEEGWGKDPNESCDEG